MNINTKELAVKLGRSIPTVKKAAARGKFGPFADHDERGAWRFEWPQCEAEFRKNSDISRLSAELSDRDLLVATVTPRAAPVAPASEPAQAVDADGDSSESFLEAKCRKERSLASLRALELAKKGGLLCLGSSVESRIAELFSACKSRLRSIPNRMKQAASEMPLDQIEMLEELIDECCEDLASGAPIAERAAADAQVSP